MMDLKRWAGLTAAGLLLLTLGVGGGEAKPRPVSDPIGSQIEAAAAMFVVDRFLNGANELRDVRRFYGESVFYFDQGVQSRDEVLADKRAYFERWPQRSLTPDLATLKTRPIPGSDGRMDVEVRLEVDFDVASGARSASGRSTVVLILAERGDAFIVLSEGGRVVSRP